VILVSFSGLDLRDFASGSMDCGSRFSVLLRSVPCATHRLSGAGSGLRAYLRRSRWALALGIACAEVGTEKFNRRRSTHSLCRGEHRLHCREGNRRIGPYPRPSGSRITGGVCWIDVLAARAASRPRAHLVLCRELVTHVRAIARRRGGVFSAPVCGRFHLGVERSLGIARCALVSEPLSTLRRLMTSVRLSKIPAACSARQANSRQASSVQSENTLGRSGFL
jgi:hypothetical protein